MSLSNFTGGPSTIPYKSYVVDRIFFVPSFGCYYGYTEEGELINLCMDFISPENIDAYFGAGSFSGIMVRTVMDSEQEHDGSARFNVQYKIIASATLIPIPEQYKNAIAIASLGRL